MATDKSKLESLEAQILAIRLDQLEDKTSKYDQLIEKLADSQIKSDNRIIRLEEQEEHMNAQLERLISANSLQNKLLVAMVTASFGTLATLLIKALGH